MSGDHLDLDAIEHEAERLGGLVDSATVLALVAEVRRLRAEVDAWHVGTRSHPPTGCASDGKGRCRYCGAEEPPPWRVVERGDAGEHLGAPDRIFRRGASS